MTQLTGAAARLYSDGRELHIVPEGEDTTVCGEWVRSRPPLTGPSRADQPICRECAEGERWAHLGGSGTP